MAGKADMAEETGVMENGLNAAMESVRRKYIEKLAVQHGDIVRLSPADGGDEMAETTAKSLRGVAHKLAGTGKIYGFPEISEAGYSLECALREGTAAPVDIGRRVRYLLNVMERAIKTGPTENGKEISGADMAPQPVMAPVSAPVAVERDLGKPGLLVIDDDEGITDLVHSLFDPVANVTICGDVASGLLAAYETQPHLILLDEEMPGERSGMDLLQQLRDMPITANVPIIMMSANDSLTSIMQALVSGATDYMIKPFDPATLVSKATGLLKTYRTRILVVDDDETVRDLLEHKLTAAGCRVDAVGECQEAWDLLEKESYSLVLLGRMMPDLDGTILLRMMHGDDAIARIPVIFLTARRSAADVVDGLLTGATDYITKPFDPDEVVKRCMTLIKAKKH